MAQKLPQNTLSKFFDLLESVRVSKYLEVHQMTLEIRSEGVHVNWSENTFELVQKVLEESFVGIDLKNIERKLRNSIKQIILNIWDNNQVLRSELLRNCHVVKLKKLLNKEFVRGVYQDMVESLELQIKNRSLVFPLDGINMKVKELKFDLFTLKMFEGSDLQNIVKQKNHLNKIGEVLTTANIYIVVDQIGDIQYTYKKSIIVADYARHILNFYLGHTYDRQNKYKKISILPKNPSATFVYGIFSEDRTGFHEEIQPYKNHTIEQKDIDIWKKNKLNEIVDCFNSKRGIQYRIKNAITWYSNGVDADTIEEQFLCLAIAMETLLGDKGSANNLDLSWGSINQKLSERSAYLLGSDLKTRRDISKLVKELYKIRSGIVHEGKEERNIDKLWEIDDIVWQCTIAIIDKFRNEEQMFEWFEEQKFTIPKISV